MKTIMRFGVESLRLSALCVLLFQLNDHEWLRRFGRKVQ